MPITKQQAREALQTLINEYSAININDRPYITEASVVRQFIDRMLEEVLGWPIKDPQRYLYEQHTEVGRPDITLVLGKDNYIYVEAKRFGGISKPEYIEQAYKRMINTLKPEQMALPSMAVDRSAEEQQAINYAFLNNGTWAILTNFEKLRLFNARRDWLVIAFETPSAYLEDFDLLWQLSYENIQQGSLDLLSNTRYRSDVDTDYLQLINRWREKLAHDIVQNRAADNPWAFKADGSIHLGLLRAVVQRFIDRLVVVRFAEDHFVIKAGTLNSFQEFLKNAHTYAPSLESLLSNFFRQFDEKHNSALFAKGLVDEAKISDQVLLSLIDDLYRARYRSMPADIMGNTYEQYLGKALVQDNGGIATRDNLETRKKQGSYYTPQVIVRYIVDNSLGRYLYGTTNGKPDGEPIDGETPKTSRDIENLRVLDSACGSGSFLIYAYEVLRDFYEGEIARLQAKIETTTDAMAADGATSTDIRIEVAPEDAEIKRLRGNYPRFILEKHLYGVDLDPQAAEIAVVNLIMRAMEGQNQDKRLPLILNQNVKVGNGLVGMRHDDERLATYQTELAEIRRLRAALIKAPHGETHDSIQRDLVAAIAALNAQLTDAMQLDAHFSDLERVRPFHWAAEFPEVFVDEDGNPLDNAGFTIVVGNPPYGGTTPIEPNKSDEGYEEKLKEYEQKCEDNDFYKQEFTTSSTADTYVLFWEQSANLVQTNGKTGMIVPSGWVSMPTMLPLRELFVDNYKPLLFASLPYDIFEDAYVDTIISIVEHLEEKAKLTDLDDLRVSLSVFPARYSITSITDFDKFHKKANAIRWLKSSNMEFLITMSDTEQDIIDKLEATGSIFSDVADIQRGVTPFHKKSKPPTNAAKAFTGTVRRYKLYDGDEAFIQYDNTLAEYKVPKYFEGPRLLLRELISRQFQLQATYTDQSFITNKSMQSFLLTDTRYDILYLLGLLNSKLLSWYFLAKNSVARRDDFPKIVLTQSRSLPFRAIDFANSSEVVLHNQLSGLVQQFIDLNQQAIALGEDDSSLTEEIEKLDSNIDVLVYELYGLTDQEIDIVQNYIQ